MHPLLYYILLNFILIQSTTDDVYGKPPKKEPIVDNPFDKVVPDAKCVYENVYDEIEANEEKPNLKRPIVVAGYTNNEYVLMP